MQNAVTLVVGIVAGLALIVLGVRWAEDRQSKKAPRPTPAEPKNWFRHLQSKTPALVGEVGTYLIAGGIGALLAWYGAVSASFQPHKLHYVAAASVIAVGAVVVGVILRVVGGKDNALIRELRAEIERLWAALAPKGAAVVVHGSRRRRIGRRYRRYWTHSATGAAEFHWTTGTRRKQ